MQILAVFFVKVTKSKGLKITDYELNYFSSVLKLKTNTNTNGAINFITY